MYAEGGCIKLIILLDTPPLLDLAVVTLPANKNLFLFFFLFV